MRGRALSVRVAGLILTGELAVHELRYAIAPVPQAGHGYLPLLGVLSVAALAVGAGQLAGVLESARRTGWHERAGLPFACAWPLLIVAITGVFAVQEAVEGLLDGAGSGALTSAFSTGGWVAVPLAIAVAALLALALTGARAAIRAAARTARAGVRHRRTASRFAEDLPRRPRGSLLALNLAGRAPPTTSLT